MRRWNRVKIDQKPASLASLELAIRKGTTMKNEAMGALPRPFKGSRVLAIRAALLATTSLIAMSITE